MLTKLTAYDLSGLIPDPLELPLTPEGRMETDIVQATNIEGLEPVEATVNTSPYASIDGAYFTGSNVADRNIVIDLLPKPDWITWDVATIRNHVYKYFMPKSFVRLTFESTERAPVEIFGYVETCKPNIFSKDNEIQVSIICPSPHFKAIDPIVIEGTTTGVAAADIENFTYNGTEETGINLKVHGGGDTPTFVSFQQPAPITAAFTVNVGVVSGYYVEINSIQGQKYVRNVNELDPDDDFTNLLNEVADGSKWPEFKHGAQQFLVWTAEAGQDWTLTYFDKYGGL